MDLGLEVSDIGRILEGYVGFREDIGRMLGVYGGGDLGRIRRHLRPHAPFDLVLSGPVTVRSHLIFVSIRIVGSRDT